MAKKKVEDEVIPEGADTNKGPLPDDVPAEAGENAGDSKGEITVKYRDHKGEVTSRVFSKEVHGKEFKSLADEFKKTNAARIVA
jgi:hypothetical protein